MAHQKINRSGASDAIRGGPLAIGESHDKTGGRKLLLELIAKGEVRTLFLEVPSANTGYFEKALAKGIMAKKGGTTRDEVRSEMSLLDSVLENPLDKAYSFSQLITTALFEGVRVIFCDKVFRGNNASESNVRRRNVFVETVFKEIIQWPGVGAGAIGCLILFGSAHFEGVGGDEKKADENDPSKQVIGANIPHTLKWVDMSNE